MTDETMTAWNEGFEAGSTEAQPENPYPPCTVLHREWESGRGTAAEIQIELREMDAKRGSRYFEA